MPLSQIESNSIDSTANLTVNSITVGGDKTSPYAGFKNRIINGAMVIDQRNNGASVSASVDSTNYFAVDRFLFQKVGAGVVTMQQSNIAPAGFSYSLKALVATVDTSVAAGDFANITHVIEGFNTTDFGFGAAGASTVTVSFWVRSNITGTYGVALVNSVGNRSYVTNYTINAANTWEQKTITVAGDTSGTWLKDNSAGFLVRFGLMVGTNFQQTAGSWGTVNAMGSSSQVNWMATVGNEFYITGVQLEKGSQATAFDYRSYATELALCQRYFYVAGAIGGGYTITVGHGISPGGSSVWRASIAIPVPLRTTPSITETNMDVWNPAFGSTAINTISTIYYLDRGIFLEVDVTTTSSHGITGGYPAWLQTKGSGGKSTFDISAEL